MATSVWKGYLTFGLISIPIRLFSAARRAHQLEPASQCLPLAHQDAAVLSGLRPQGGAQRNREGLRIRKRSVRALRRKGAGQDRAGIRALDGNSRVRAAGGNRSALL